ncbi:glutamate decarboxylase 1 [Chrysoperla carnea]|uniref:glutamate decarboxylase 1 n=1 Tax=Chrysoperla carnea TaxID=189513 RepID=UPI001D085A5B|nr:glutamate decarboxylase 1 [Chrysoperla carnea]
MGQFGFGQEKTTILLTKVCELLKKTNILEVPTTEPIIQFLQPNELQKTINITLNDQCLNDEQFEKILSDVLKYSVKTAHPYFFNQLYGGTDCYGLAGAWITEALNTSQYTYEVAPVFTLIEQTVITKILELVHFENGDGIFAPGGSISNMYSIVLARFRALPNVKTQGMKGVQLVAFTSQDAHYSIEKGVHWLGIGTDNLVKVKTNDYGQMIPEELEKAIIQSIQNGNKPFYVNATAGTTVLGSFDPFTEIARICTKYQLWLHIDACWGGSLLLSRKYQKQLKGIELADSVSWNPHKMLGAPLQCSVFLVKEKGILHQCNCVGAKYLFQQDKFYDVSYDTGDKSIQCGRKVDAFKLWCMWKARGNLGFESLVDVAMDCADYIKRKIQQIDGFRLVQNDFECTNICFWYIPKILRHQKETKEWWDIIHTVAPKIKEQMTRNGSLMVGYTPLSHKNKKNFFRVVVTCQPSPCYDDMDHIINEIQSLGERLSLSL